MLLELARRTITRAVLEGGPGFSPVERLPGAIERPCGVFVSLHTRGRLRGCIGQLESPAPLAETVARCAVAAALEDPRFPSLRSEELGEVQIEISVLSRPERIEASQVRVGEHGLLVTRGRMRGLLLPQVAREYRWTSERFLQETCAKAGLERDAWKDPATRIEAFTAEVFSEAEFSAGKRAQAS